MRQSRFEAIVKVKLPIQVCRPSVKHGELECKLVLTVQIFFLSKMVVNKVRYRRNWRDNYLVSETVSQLCNN